MPKEERTKELSFRLWKEEKSLPEIQAQVCRDSKVRAEARPVRVLSRSTWLA
jgi:hypothetical protein